MNIKFAHISDLHFGSLTLSPLQFFSKRWLGNLNYIALRRKDFIYDQIFSLINLFKEQKISHVIITGDLSVTSAKKEFKKAKDFIQLLKNEGFEVITIPGNHDHYTKRAYNKKVFYNYFEERFDLDCPFSLKEHKITYSKIGKQSWIVALDTAVATSLISSQGYFSPNAEEHLEQALSSIPKEDTIILVNHFPFFETEPVKKQLVRGQLLKKLISKYPNIKLYLHGHTHRQSVADLRENQLPIISDSGSTVHRKTGACHLFELGDKELKLDVYRFDEQWQKKETHQFNETLV